MPPWVVNGVLGMRHSYPGGLLGSMDLGRNNGVRSSFWIGDTERGGANLIRLAVLLQAGDDGDAAKIRTESQSMSGMDGMSWMPLECSMVKKFNWATERRRAVS